MVEAVPPWERHTYGTGRFPSRQEAHAIFREGLPGKRPKGLPPIHFGPISAGRRPVAANLEEYAGKMRLDGLVGATVSPQVRPEKFIFFICKRWYNKISIIRIKEHIT